MAGASVSFLIFAAVVILFANLSQRSGWRQSVLLIASLAFVWMCADKQSLVPLAAFIGLGYVGLKVIESGRVRSATPIVVLTILIYVWLKRYTFVPSALFLPISYSTLGLSYIFFRVVHLFEDASSGVLPGAVTPISYSIYTLNFATLVAGPIQRYQEFFSSQRDARRPSVVRVGVAIERIITGYFKVNVMALIFSMVQAGALAQVMAATNWQGRVLQGAVAIASYSFFLYCNFSGYIDIVIGIAMLMGLSLPENFDRPFSARCFIDFWNRWHITLSTWLKTYVYNPLLMGLVRRFPSESLAPLWGVISFFVTFFLVGAWHGQTSSFLFFGVLQGFGVSMNKVYEIALTAYLGRKRARVLTSNGIYIAISRGLTFTWFSFTLLWFWSSWSKLALLARTTGASAIIASLGLILVAATIGLSIWEVARAALLRIQLGQEVVLRSRYTRTAWCTALVLFSIVTELLFRQQAPEIVYKAF
jgi:D-alanyl-lipoteichoic acid acyltransferase DltB (MBOAT superfamily)